jgi:Rrf2 family protein
MIHMASLPLGSRPNRAELAVAAECPEQFLSKVLQNLTRAGLITSHRGNTGGFELPRSRRAASILEVVEAVEGPIRLNLCLTSGHACDRQSWCPAQNVWAEAQKAMSEVLQKATIGELAQKVLARRDESPVLGGPTWA